MKPGEMLVFSVTENSYPYLQRLRDIGPANIWEGEYLTNEGINLLLMTAADMLLQEIEEVRNGQG